MPIKVALETTNYKFRTPLAVLLPDLPLHYILFINFDPIFGHIPLRILRVLGRCLSVSSPTNDYDANEHPLFKQYTQTDHQTDTTFHSLRKSVGSMVYLLLSPRGLIY